MPFKLLFALFAILAALPVPSAVAAIGFYTDNSAVWTTTDTNSSSNLLSPKTAIGTAVSLGGTSALMGQSAYSAGTNSAVQWLAQNQNSDGSWGGTEEVKYPCTAEVVMAFRALNIFTPAYYWGITWLENHNPNNIDFASRRIFTLTSHGDNLQNDLTSLQLAQALTSPGNSGWGLNGIYQGTSLDSALALIAYSSQGITANVQAALNYLKSAQLTGSDKGWSLAQETTSDPATTAFVIQALYGYRGFDSSVYTNISNGIASLGTSVNTGSPTHLQGLVALTYLTSGYPANATSLLNSLSSTQSPDGSWSQNIYATALAARALADYSAVSTQNIRVTVNDFNLRRAINQMLGKNGMDSLTRGDLANLVSLTAVGMGITDLTGLEWAANLTTADLRDNKITSLAPLAGLTNLTAYTSGNPIGSSTQICSNSPVRLFGKTYHTTFQSAYDAAETGDIIQSNAVELSESVNLNRTVAIVLGGGYTCDYGSNANATIISGELTISDGTVEVVNIVIR